jgi:aryl-alcohol dehydrogenase-like predicted oxidoreductase
MHLGIGTVQFGQNYGISNKDGKTSREEVRHILSFAHSQGVSFLDTAPIYGMSEEVLGQILSRDDNFKIVTKVHPLSQDCFCDRDLTIVEETFSRSLLRLQQQSIYGLLVHQADDLLGANGNLLIAKMIEFKERGLVKKIGASVYNQWQIEAILERHKIDLIQIPINVLDCRLLLSGTLEKLKDIGIEIHARSIFLQGLLLMNPDSLSRYFDSIKEHLKIYHQEIEKYNLTPVEAALRFVKSIKYIDAILCGVNNLNQLQEILNYWQNPQSLNTQDFLRFAISDPAIVEPSQWQT